MAITLSSALVFLNNSHNSTNVSGSFPIFLSWDISTAKANGFKLLHHSHLGPDLALLTVVRPWGNGCFARRPAAVRWKWVTCCQLIVWLNLLSSPNEICLHPGRIGLNRDFLLLSELEDWKKKELELFLVFCCAESQRRAAAGHRGYGSWDHFRESDGWSFAKVELKTPILVHVELISGDFFLHLRVWRPEVEGKCQR